MGLFLVILVVMGLVALMLLGVLLIGLLLACVVIMLKAGWSELRQLRHRGRIEVLTAENRRLPGCS